LAHVQKSAKKQKLPELPNIPVVLHNPMGLIAVDINLKLGLGNTDIYSRKRIDPRRYSGSNLIHLCSFNHDGNYLHANLLSDDLYVLVVKDKNCIKIPLKVYIT